MRRVGARDERGQSSVLLVGLFVVAVLLVAVVVDASAAYLRRQELDSLADGAALAAAEGIAAERVYEGGLGDRAELDPVRASRLVADHLRAVGDDHGPGLRWRVSTGGDTVRVRVWAPMQLPLSPPGWAASTTVTAEASALVRVSR